MSTSVGVLMLALLGLMLLGATSGLVWSLLRYRKLKARFGPVVDLEAECDKVRAEIQRLATDREEMERASAARRAALGADFARAKDDLDRQKAALSASYAKSREVYERLKKEVALLEENLEDMSFGLYKAHYSFDTPEHYRAELAKVTAAKKALVRDGRATQALVQWTVGGSRKEGERMQKQLQKLMLRAFNGESDAAIAKVAWNNAAQMEERIRKAFDAVNQQGTVVQVAITPAYRDLALAELRLEHELAEKKRAEAEEQRRIREQMREEERAQRELERAQEESVAEESRYEKALAKARADITKANAEQAAAISARIAQLEAQLAEAHAKAERAKSMAQLTKSGHVYIISNVGSFGDAVYKIGMTRRLEPLDRVKELGDASVPFEFDVHGLVWAEDAPALENALHRHFNEHRVNLVNPRKEFFKIELTHIEQFLVSRGLTIQLTQLAEAREYRESTSLRLQGRASTALLEGDVQSEEAFPDRL